ncbi:MAG: UDP-N-acetylmuramate dehydrogenase [Actinomycetota bacterium]|nr:UDP-N-acetylmuramate dehydrogenase [Actinomycetota bacterium]
MRVGGPARRLVTATTADDVIDAVREADASGEPLLVLGGGSNVVVADKGFAGTVVRIATRGVTVDRTGGGDEVKLRVAAGEDWDDLVARAVTQGWSGIEALSGIPGSTGATPVQNVSAYGQEVAQTLTEVRVWDRSESCVRTLSAADCEFSYRHSTLKESMLTSGQFTPRCVVLDVTFQLLPRDLSQPIGYADLARGLGVEVGARVPLRDAREAVLAQRRSRGMVLDPADHDTWSCGSFFTNPILPAGDFAALQVRVLERLGERAEPPQFPGAGGAVKTSAAWLIDRAGFSKGHGMPGPAALSTKHTLAVTNRGAAGSADVVTLAREVRDGVQEAFGVRLVNEPVLVDMEL